MGNFNYFCGNYLMEAPKLEELRELSEKIGVLTAQRDEARALLKEAQEEVKDLQSELDSAREELRKMTLDVEYLTVSRRLADNPQSLADARATVKGLLDRVNKAIALLEDDARI